MKWLHLCVGLALLMGCNMPSGDFRGVPATRITVEGSTFDVRVQGKRAEAMRINPQYAPRFGSIEQRASFAMQQVSGCRVVKVTGDQALAFGRLDCGEGPGSVQILPRDYTCVPIRGSEIKEIGQLRVALDCDPD